MTLCSVKTSPDLVDKVSLKWFPRPRGDDMGRPLTLREALASDRLADFVRQAEAHGDELAKGSELERALALLITQRRSEIAVSLSLKSGISLTTNASASETSWLGRLGGQPRHFPANEITVHAVVANQRLRRPILDDLA